MVEGRKETCICMNGCHSDDVGFVGLWCLYCNYLLTRLVFLPHTFTPINMFTGDQITESTCRNIETLHETTLDDLIKNKNGAVWQLLAECNKALRERYVHSRPPFIGVVSDCFQKQVH